MTTTRDAIERFGDRIASLVRPRKTEALPICIIRNRIYILPTRFGLFIAAALFTMLVGGLNYNNNPALVLVFLLVGVAHNSLVHAHLILSGIRLKSLHAEPVHAGQPLCLRLRFDAEGHRDRPGLQLLCGDTTSTFELAPGDDVETTLELPTQHRGWLEPGRLRLSTLQPFGLARAWSWLRPNIRLLVYPTPERSAPPLPESHGEGDSQRTRALGEQPHHLREYRSGDMPRQIAWKASAHVDRLLVREYESTVAREICLDWQTLRLLPYEARIARLTRWLLDAERSGSRYALHLPSQRIAAGSGAEHCHTCLRALALLPVSEQAHG